MKVCLKVLHETQKQNYIQTFFWQLKYGYWPKGNRTIADFRYGGEDIISPSTLIFAPIKSYLGIYTLHIPPEVL